MIDKDEFKDKWKFEIKNLNYKELIELHFILRDEIKKKWNRVLPFNEEITDRWEKAKYLVWRGSASMTPLS